MEMKFNVTGKERKALVTAVGEIVGAAPVYKGAPTFAYEVNGFTIDKNGTLTGEAMQELLTALTEKGFAIPEIPTLEEPMDIETEVQKGVDMLVIEMPLPDFTEPAIFNLEKLVESKGKLIKKVLGTDSLPIERTENTLRFPWFSPDLFATSDELKAYTRFITALCDMAKEQKRITATAKEVANEKYAFRCFLLRLGFIGEEYKTDRKILLTNLSGNSAFKSGECKKNMEVSESE